MRKPHPRPFPLNNKGKGDILPRHAQRQRQRDGGAFAGRALKADFAAQRPRPFAHSEQTQRMRVGQRFRREAAPVVAHRQRETGAMMMTMAGMFSMKA